ncbi:hypothetical protein SAMN05444141_10827 [Pseudovibrio denitrificans]|uniref:Uncharacterized protein n=1 Tax=Pseudovibrio denitrificans TaxID=258256 RepID=A0A1I7D9J3_9HYPH|nr:hypothetical protein SAMN05444141_10827 [Pseudovibrio denitrificans]
MISPTQTCRCPLHLATNYYNIPIEALFCSSILNEDKHKRDLYGYIHRYSRNT